MKNSLGYIRLNVLAEDKKKELDFLLKSEKERQLLENENKTEKKNNLIMVF